MIGGMREQALYIRAVEKAERALDLYVEVHGYEPVAIYATPDMISVLGMGPRLLYKSDHRQPTLFGIEVRTCSGAGMQFHFAEEIFVIEGEVRP